MVHFNCNLKNKERKLLNAIERLTSYKHGVFIKTVYFRHQIYEWGKHDNAVI